MSQSDDNHSQQLAKLLADELFEYCESDTISEEGIHKIIEHHKESTPNNNLSVSDYEFFHSACSSAKVTEGIIRCLLEYFPAAAATDDEDRICSSDSVGRGRLLLLLLVVGYRSLLMALFYYDLSCPIALAELT